MGSVVCNILLPVESVYLHMFRDGGVKKVYNLGVREKQYCSCWYWSFILGRDMMQTWESPSRVREHRWVCK